MNATEPSRGFKAAARFIPTIDTPVSAILPINIASICLLLACCSFTFKSRVATVFRTLLFFPTVYSAYEVAYGIHDIPSRSVSMGLTLMGLVGIMRAFDICIVSLLDAEPPHWIQNGKRTSMPTSLAGRFIYGFDMVSFLRNVAT